MNISLRILGTASAMPVSDRNPSAQVLSVHGRLFLLDCGEGTQRQMRRAHLSFARIEAVFISHIHGDHVLGIFGMLSSMAKYGRTQPLDIYAPQAFGPMLKFYLSYYGAEGGFAIMHHVVKVKEPAEIYRSKCISVTAFPLQHGIECYGWRFDELAPEGRPDYTPFPAHSYAYCSDTAPFPELQEWVRGVDLLYHEATYLDEHRAKAVQYHHSTASDAARVARGAGVGKLVIGHYSSRVNGKAPFEQEARAIFPETYAADDLDDFILAR